MLLQSTSFAQWDIEVRGHQKYNLCDVQGDNNRKGAQWLDLIFVVKFDFYPVKPCQLQTLSISMTFN